jgi:TonB family protein
MSENILVVEYEPRYTDRVRHALAGQPVNVAFAKDGEEALRAIDALVPALIVMTAVVPKVSAPELIKAIRSRNGLQKTPILLTVSGYTGKNPVMDAQKVGATDILPKPYTEADLIGRIQQMLGVTLSAPAVAAAPAAAADPAKKKSDDLDKILADTLSGARVPKKTGPPTSPGTVPKPADGKPRSSSDLDKLLNDTLSGLEKTVKKVSTSPGNVPTPAAATPAAPAAPEPKPQPAPVAAPAPAPRPAAPAPAAPVAAAPAPAPAPAAPAPTAFTTEKLPVLDSIPVSQPIFPVAAEPVREEEEEPTDGTKFGQYVLLDRIATGGMAEVWKARMRGVEGFQKTVAIKKILPHLSDNQDFIEMFIDEAKLAAQLSHNNIIHIYDLGKIQSSYYIAMEYVDGSDLKTILRKAQEHDQPMSVELALFIASKIASALDYAHRKRDFQDQEMGLVHRDVSPQNVLISEEGDIKLCDFGIAKAASKASHTQAGALKGKLQYMSPEQAWGRAIDRRSDIFALATVLYEMLTGRKLFAGDNELSILDQVREARVAAPSVINDEVTPEVDRIVAKALAKDPTERYQTAGEMARDLDAVLYSFKPTPTSADLAIYMHRLAAPVPVIAQPEFDSEPEPEPEPKVLVPLPPPPAPVAAPVAAAVAAAPATGSHMPAWEAPKPEVAPAASAPSMFDSADEPKKSPVAAIAIAAVAVLAIGGGFFFMKGRGDAAPATASAPVSGQIAAASTTGLATPTGGPIATDSATTAPLTATAVAPATTTTLDPKLIDQEVQKRLAAERARLEQQARSQQATTAAVPAAAAAQPVRNVPAPAPTATQAPAPEPVQERPAPVQQPAPQVAETPRPAAAAPAQAEPARAREGELIPTGTEGLVQPRITKRASVPYPPLAKVQKVQGTVICSVLVSETGDVLDVRVLRGNNRGVGLNEAAEQMMRRSSFAPGTKDGVRVKAWTTVPVDFKL